MSRSRRQAEPALFGLLLASERTAKVMRFLKGLAVGLVAVGLVGCSVGASEPSPAPADPQVVTSTAPPASPASPQMRAGARAAAAQFYGLYSASQFAAFWNLLAPATKHQVPRSVWLSVHEACSSSGAGKPRVIKAVTVFGTAAIVTEAVPGVRPGTAEDVFNYVDGHWSYSPGDPSIYHHGSVAADVAAARTAGFCGSWKIYLSSRLEVIM